MRILQSIFWPYFFQPSVSSIVADFEKTAARLEKLSSDQALKVATLNDQIDDLCKLQDTAAAECDRAHSVAGNIRKLISAS